MIRKSFIILDRVGFAKERMIWRQGISNWQEFLDTDNIVGIGKKSKAYYNRQLIAASNALRNLDSSYFCSLGADSWRLYNYFNDAVFLDIEVSGVGRFDDITMVGLYDGLDSKVMIAGANMDIRALSEHLKQYKLIITFNGKVFDIPFLKKRYPELIPRIPVIDLRHLCARIGLNGGLKIVEKELGIVRPDLIDKMYGGYPYRLYRMWRATGDEYYLKMLIEYNELDVVNLEPIIKYCIKKLVSLISADIQKA